MRHAGRSRWHRSLIVVLVVRDFKDEHIDLYAIVVHSAKRWVLSNCSLKVGRKRGKIQRPSCSTTFLRQSLVTLCGGVKKGSSTRQKREKEIIRLVLDTPTIELFCISMTRSKGTTGCDSTTKLSSTADPNRSRFTSFCVCSIPSF